MHSNSKALNVLIALIFFVSLSAAAQGPGGPPPGGGPGAPPPGGPGAPPPGGPGGPPANSAQQKTVVASISFKGNSKFTDAQLSKAVGLKVGDPLSPDIVKKALDRLIAYYRSHDANLSVSPNIDPGDGHATVQFIIDENGTKGDAGMFQPNGGGPSGGAPPPGGPPPAGR